MLSAEWVSKRKTWVLVDGSDYPSLLVASTVSNIREKRSRILVKCSNPTNEQQCLPADKSTKAKFTTISKHHIQEEQREGTEECMVHSKLGA